MNVLEKLFGKQDNATRKIRPLLAQVNGLESEIQKLSSSELRAKTESLKNSIRAGRSLSNVLPEAFVLVREASRRTLGQRHFDVQILGGIVLHEGKIAEMRTGEGKTLVATLPAYLNALEGKGVHVVTVNDYLAKRDTVWMGQIYYALGISVGCITHDASYLYDPGYQEEIQSSKSKIQNDQLRDTVGGFKVQESYLKPVSRKEAYAADITYGTNNEFGFDYLRDNMAYDLASQVQPRLPGGQGGQHFAIIDEVDSILIDEARTPLIISAPDQESSAWYRDFARIIPRLEPARDYEKDEKLRTVSLTEPGIDKVEHLLGLRDIYQEKGIKYLHHLEQALKAQVLFERDKDYVVKDGQIVIVDEFTGRMLLGRRYSGGLHQALEAKEGVVVQPESLTLASISFQNYFRLYKKLAGMTGTAQTSAEEFFKVYGLEVVSIPTNKPMVRQDMSDRVYQTEKAKFQAVAGEVAQRHAKGQPVLVGTVSIQKNEYLSALLKTEGIPHEVLNAKAHEREGEIIAQAGKNGAVTIATNMAGRGVDIILGGNPPSAAEAEIVRSVGGLHVIGTERHEARRIDNQLRGRSGRQGDPGSSQFFLSLDDDLVRIFGGEKMQQMMKGFKIPEDQPIESKLVSSAVESAQGKVEGFNFDARKHLLEYDDVLNKHREVLYKKRKEILEKAQEGSLQGHVLEIVEKLRSKEEYEKKEQELGPENMRQAEKFVCLRVIDSLWIEHLENMEQLRDSVRLRAYGQQDPLVEYKNEGHTMFKGLLENIDALIAQSIFGVSVVPQQKVGLSAVAPASSSVKTSEGKKVGRNDPCPCGASHPDGRPIKYKHCHGKNT